MTNRLITILFILITTVAIVGEAGRVFMSPPERWRVWLQLLTAQQLADTLYRQVQIGPVTDLTMRGVHATSLAVAEGWYLAEGAILTAERVEIGFNLHAILRGDMAPAAAISRVHLEEAWVYVMRDADGVVNLEDLLPEPVPPPPPPEERFRGVITMVDSTVIYDDYALPVVEGTVVNLELVQVNAEIDMTTIGWAQIVFSGRDRLGRTGPVRAEAVIELESGYAWARTNIASADIAYWSARMVDAPDFALMGGVADVDAAIGMLPRPGQDTELAVSAEVSVRGANMTLAALGGRRVLADMEATVTPEGARIHRLVANVDGTRVQASGFVGDPGDPILDLAFEADSARASDLISLLPELDPETQARLRALTVAGPVLVSGQIQGAIEQANLNVDVALPGEARFVSPDAGEYLATAINLRLDLLDLSDPNVRARADIARAVAVDPEPLRAMLPEGLEGPIEIAPLENISADLLWSAEIPLVQTELALPRLAVGDLVVEDILTDLAVAGDIVRFTGLSARPLGATLVADGVLDLGADDGTWVWARGRIDDLDLRRVQQLPGIDVPEELSGVFSGDFVAEVSDGTPYVVAHAVIEQPQYGRFGADALRGILVMDEDAVQLHGATFEDALAVGWVRGIMPFDADMVASFSVGGVSLAAVAERFDLDVENLGGEAFITGSMSGTIENPNVDAMVRVFDLTVDDYHLDAVIASLQGDLDELRIADLHASTGRIVVQADITLRDIDLDELDAELDGVIAVSGPVDEYALELADMSGEDIAGAVRASLDLGGTLHRPSLDGQVRLDYARYETIATDGAILTVNLEGDVLELTDLRIAIGDALVTGEAILTSIYDTPIVSANMMAENVVLQDLALWQDIGVPLSGEINLPFVSLQGPLDNLSGMAQLEATDLELGTEQIGAISAIMVLDRNTIMLRRTAIALAGGVMFVEGHYRFDENRVLPSQVDFEDVSIGRLLAIGVPLARRFADPPPREIAADEMPLSDQLASLSMRLRGRMDGTIMAEGVVPDLPEDVASEDVMLAYLDAFTADLDVAIREPSFDNRGLPSTVLQASVAEGTEVLLNIEATEGDGLITAFGTWEPTTRNIDVLAEVSSLNLADLRDWIPVTVRRPGGELNVTVQVSGTVDEPELIGSLDVINPAAYGVTFDLLSAPIIRYDGDMLDIDSLVLRQADEEFFVHGLIPFDWDTMSVPSDGQLQLVARADNTDLGIFPPIIADAFAPEDLGPSPLDDVEATGVLDAFLSIAGTPTRPELTGELHLDARSIVLPWLESPIEDTVVRVDFRGVEGTTFVELQQMFSRYEALTVEAGGRAQMVEYEIARLTENIYDFALEVSAPQQSFANGTLTARRVRGNVTLVTDELGEQVLTVNDLGANFGDGTVLMNGTVGLRTFEPAQLEYNDYDLQLVADRARPRYRNLFQGTIDGTITMQNPASEEPVLVAGTMTLSNAVIGVPRPSAEEAEDLRGASEAFPAPRFDVRLAIGSDVQVRTLGMSAPLQPTDTAIWARGTPQRPNIQGQVEVQEGQASLPGGVIDILTAGVRFLIRPAFGTDRLPPPVDLDLDGRVWATASRTVETVVVDGRVLGPVELQMVVSGTLPDNIHVEVRSTPPLAEEQILALLGTAPFAGADGFLEGGDLGQVMTEQFVSALGAAFRHYIFQPFEEDLRDIFGLEFVEVSFAFDQPIALRLGGYLIENLLITYQTTIVGPWEGYDIAVSYQVDRNFEVSYRTDETDDHRLLVEYVRRF